MEIWLRQRTLGGFFVFTFDLVSRETFLTYGLPLDGTPFAFSPILTLLVSPFPLSPLPLKPLIPFHKGPPQTTGQISSLPLPTEPHPAYASQKPLFLNPFSKALPALLALPPIRHLRQHEVPPFLLLLHQRFLLGAALEVEAASGRVRGGFGADEGGVLKGGIEAIGFGAALSDLGFFVDGF